MNNNDYNYNELSKLAEKYGSSFYILDSEKFAENYDKMLLAFRTYYLDTYIAYSYKTNYIPKLCKIVNEKGGYAEVVSGMEMNVAVNTVKVDPFNIYFNGPYKQHKVFEMALRSGVHINIDSEIEAEQVIKCAKENLCNEYCVGVRCALDIGQDVPSRFGLDFDSGDLIHVINKLNECENVKVNGLHIHLPFRELSSFSKRMNALERILSVLECRDFDYISVGGGYKGELSSEMKILFGNDAPQYLDYAREVAGSFNKIVCKMGIKPKLIIEPGSALVADTMQYVTRVVSIKKSRDKYYATLTGSTYNINPSVKNFNRPIAIFSLGNDGNEYQNLDMTGYTCIEGDRLYTNYSGKLNVNDFVIFNNVGSYSIDMKPPFIMEDIPIIELVKGDEILIRKAQTVQHIFENYIN